MAHERHNQPGVLIHEIASDKTSGAAEILRLAGEVFKLLTAEGSALNATVEGAQQTVLALCIALARAKPEMSPLLRLTSVVVAASRTATNAKRVLELAEQAAYEFVDGAKRANRRTAVHAARTIGFDSRVLTLSRSSTVLAAFVESQRAGNRFSVIATESRPGLEGRTLADELRRHHISVTLIADAAASLAMDQVDLVLLGADRITPQNVVNKIGTRMVTLAARERGLGVHVVCDTSKFIIADYFVNSSADDGGAEELWPELPEGIGVLNRYFEATPLSYFSSIITEDGPISIEEAALLAEKASIDQALIEGFEKLGREIK
ncbi:MAG: hypothetical protein WAV20_18760 [Blastocatellia bacterium]